MPSDKCRGEILHFPVVISSRMEERILVGQIHLVQDGCVKQSFLPQKFTQTFVGYHIGWS